MTIQLGFLEALEWTTETQNDFSISRLGGLPTWPIQNPPSQKDLQCGTCSRPLRLLTQLYAPTDAEDILRIVYIFLCKDGRCQKPGFSPAFKVFRIQTPWSSIKIPQTCPICNLPGTVSSDSMVFCSQEHLERYQRSLKSTRPKGKYPPQDIAWKPMEIVSDEEPEDLDIDMGGINLNTSRVEDDESTAGETYSKPIGDRTFQKFVRRIERAPEQILRYIRLDGTTGEVLHCAAEGVLEEKAYPKCRECNGETDVECQIMPGLLAQMDSDVGGKEELDWGVLNVLTCTKSCKSKDGYVEEFLWRQEVSPEGLKSEADM